MKSVESVHSLSRLEIYSLSGTNFFIIANVVNKKHYKAEIARKVFSRRPFLTAMKFHDLLSHLELRDSSVFTFYNISSQNTSMFIGAKFITRLIAI